MAWHWPGDKPLSEQMMVSLLTHIYITRTQWVETFGGKAELFQKNLVKTFVADALAPRDDVIKWKCFPCYWPLWGESTSHWWIPLTMASDTDLWFFLWSSPEQMFEKKHWDASDLRHDHAHYDVTVMLGHQVVSSHDVDYVWWMSGLPREVISTTCVPYSYISCFQMVKSGHYKLPMYVHPMPVFINVVCHLAITVETRPWLSEVRLICHTQSAVKFCQPFWKLWLIHWRRVMHIYISKMTIIDSDNGLLPGRHQAIIWTNAAILLIEPLGTSFSEILIKIYTYWFKNMHLKMSSGKWWPFCLCINVLNQNKCTQRPSKLLEKSGLTL